MGKSISAAVLSKLLKLWPKLTEEEEEEKIAGRIVCSRLPCQAPESRCYIP